MNLNFRTFILTLSTSFTITLNAATWTWTGANSNNWDTKANWSTVSSSSRPQSGDDVFINSGAINQPRLTNSRTIRNLTINGGLLDTRTYDLTVNSTITINGGAFTNSDNNETGNIHVDYVIVNTSTPFSINSLGTLLINVSENVSFTSGIIETSSDDLLIIRDNSTVSGASNSSHVDGPVRKIGNDAFTFPIGNGTVYAPVGISDFSSNSSSQYSTASYAYNSPSGSLNGGGVLSNTENWSLIRSNVNQISKITLFYDASLRSGGISDSSDLAVAIYNGSVWTPVNAITAGSNQSGSITSVTRVSGSIQRVTFASPNGLNALPVELIGFSGMAQTHSIQLVWSTVNEINNDFFTIEKSMDGKNWVEISKIKGAIHSSNVLEYQVIDNNPVNGIQYYRLIQTDLNGKLSIASALAVQFNQEVNAVKVFPNPANNNVYISLNAENEEPSDINIMNEMGQVILTLKAQTGNISIDISELETGIYTVEVLNNIKIEKIKLAKN